jgi:hypothetical protein
MEWASRVRSGGIDHDEVVVLLGRRERVDEAGELDGLVVLQVLRRAARDTEMLGDGELAAGMLRPSAPVLDVMRQGLLPQVEIDAGNPLAKIHQRDGDMHGDRGFSRTAFLVPQHHDVCGCRPPSARLHQHYATSRRS